jgi:hypothetical protein
LGIWLSFSGRNNGHAARARDLLEMSVLIEHFTPPRQPIAPGGEGPRYGRTTGAPQPAGDSLMRRRWKDRAA